MLGNLLQTRFPNDNLLCVYNIGVGTTTMSSTMNFRLMTNDFVKALQGISSWYDNHNEEIGHPDYYNLLSVNEVLKYSNQASPNTSFETGFIDLLNTHNVYIHSSNSGHYSPVGVRGENTITKKSICFTKFWLSYYGVL